FQTIQEAQRAGITLIFQELNNCPNLKPLDNLFLGHELRHAGPFLDYATMRKKALELFDYLGIHVDLDAEVGRLSTAVQQMIEIAKALLTDVKLLIMDEPTSSLSDKETAKLFQVIRELKSRGISVVFISHKLNEVFEITDRVVVLRDGENAGVIDPKTDTMDQLIACMVGRELDSLFTRRTNDNPGEVLLKVEDLSGPPHVEGVSFELRRGEILGLAGLIGAGRTEMARLLIGAVPRTRGRVSIEGKAVHIKSPSDAIAAGIAYLPEDRKVQALILPMSVRENLTMSIHRLVVRLRVFISRSRENAITDSYVASLGIKVSDREQTVNNLSGGNQQKVVIAKWLATEPRILILDEPTRGIDVAAKAEVHRMISELADRGVSILLISSELPEILALSDRVMVMHEGRAKATLNRAEASQETIMSAALIQG
ncbi:MAG TPA: sugar ABC transporter ATP-binding protein, partial [Holophaga sp.]|nr:sugar ABC transporter ATP-binding protein [Holophaga sp.]